MAQHNPKSSLGWLRDLMGKPVKEERTMIMPPSDRALFDTTQVQSCCLGSATTGRRLLEAVLTHGPELLDAVLEDHREGNAESLLHRVHDLRGVAQILGAYSSAQVCLRIEMRYESAGQNERDHIIASLQNQVGPMFDAIRMYLHAWAA